MNYMHPIVILTANALVGQEEEYIKTGFDSFLSKPIMTERLNAVLVKYVKDKQTPEVLAAAERDKPSAKKTIDDFSEDIYVLGHLRTDFVKNHKNSFDDITAALASGDAETAQILAHTLKGLAGLIHENDLAQSAAQVEKVLAAGKTPSTEELTTLSNDLAQVIEAVGKPEATKFLGLDTEEAKEVFDKLAPLLELNNATSLKMVEQIRTMPEMAVLARQIEDFEFEQALCTLGTLRKILEV
jgi:HPt (histidine-containing phosphotransfer) domain-containing protein